MTINNQKGHISFTVSLVFVALLTLAGLAVYRIYDTTQTSDKTEVSTLETPAARKETTSFVFTAAGDFESNTNSDKVLSAIGEADSDFTLALGDLGYGGNGTEQQWCEFVQARVGNDHPFEILAGNHDDGTRDGDLAKYLECLPNKLNDVYGDYGSEYYFDHNDLARFILISPNINNYGYDYTEGSEHYSWVESAIQDAHEKELKWIILGMHKNCITPGVKTCEVGEDIMNLAIENNVDLILQGHEHGYFRSKQLSFNDDCPALTIDNVNHNCVSGTGDQFIGGNGAVIVISGAGGYRLRDVDLNDPEMDYFETWNGANIGNTYGFSRFTVSDESIKAEFVPVGNGQYTDSFTITRAAQ